MSYKGTRYGSGYGQPRRRSKSPTSFPKKKKKKIDFEPAPFTQNTKEIERTKFLGKTIIEKEKECEKITSHVPDSVCEEKAVSGTVSVSNPVVKTAVLVAKGKKEEMTFSKRSNDGFEKMRKGR